jgi:hypothetical protein
LKTACVTLEDVLVAAGARAASLVPETSGYLTLAVADATSRLPLGVEDRAVLLTTEGNVTLARRGPVVSPPVAAASMRDVLARLLAVSAGSMPGLASAARPRKESDLGVDATVAEIEAALIPVNRAAARRALARLARETWKARDAGRLKGHTAPAPARQVVVTPPCPASREAGSTIIGLAPQPRAPERIEPAKAAPIAPEPAPTQEAPLPPTAELEPVAAESPAETGRAAAETAEPTPPETADFPGVTPDPLDCGHAADAPVEPSPQALPEVWSPASHGEPGGAEQAVEAAGLPSEPFEPTPTVLGMAAMIVESPAPSVTDQTLIDAPVSDSPTHAVDASAESSPVLELFVEDLVPFEGSRLTMPWGKSAAFESDEAASDRITLPISVVAGDAAPRPIPPCDDQAAEPEPANAAPDEGAAMVLQATPEPGSDVEAPATAAPDRPEPRAELTPYVFELLRNATREAPPTPEQRTRADELLDRFARVDDAADQSLRAAATSLKSWVGIDPTPSVPSLGGAIETDPPAAPLGAARLERFERACGVSTPRSSPI